MYVLGINAIKKAIQAVFEKQLSREIPISEIYFCLYYPCVESSNEL